MKKSLIVLLILITHSAFADLRGALRSHQRTLGAATPADPGAPRPGVVSAGPQRTSVTVARCEETRQTSLPLSNLLDLVQDSAPAILPQHDPVGGILTISSANIIGNCTAMLEEPTINEKQINGVLNYAVEIKFKKGEECTFVKNAQGVDTDVVHSCKYNVMKKTGDNVSREPMIFEPSLPGFKKCLEDSGVVKNNALVPDAIYPQAFRHSFENIKQPGTLVFQSHGPLSITSGAAHGNFRQNEACDYYENITAQESVLYSAAQIQERDLQAAAERLRNCSLDQLDELNRFIENNPAFSFLKQIRETLISDAAKAAATKISSGNYTPEDLSVFESFQQYIVQPRIDDLRRLYAEIQNMPSGAEKTARTTELNRLKQQLGAMNASPYFTAAHVNKMVTDGHFDSADLLYGVRASVAVYAKLGQRINNIDINNTSAEEQIAQARVQNGIALETARDHYDVRTGQVTRSPEILQSVQDFREAAQENQQVYAELIQEERMALQQCQRQPWSAQRCMQEANEAIQDLSRQAAEALQEDNAELVRLEGRALEYQELERQGRVFTARQNGEEVSRADRKPITRSSRSTASRVTADQGQQGQQQQSQQQMMMAYQQQLAQQQAQQWQLQLQQMQQVYPGNGQFSFTGGQQQGSYNPFLSGGQQGYNPLLMGGSQLGQFQGGLNFNLGGQVGQQSPYGYNLQQQPWGQAAYNPYQYNMYGQSALLR